MDLEGISDIVDSPEANEKAQEIADHAVTLVRNGSSMIPLAAPDKVCYVIMPESRLSTEGLAFSQEVHKIAPRATVPHVGSLRFTREQVDEALRPSGGLSKLRSGGIRVRGGVSRHGGHAGRGTAPRARGVDRHRQAGGTDRPRQSVRAAQFRQGDRVPGHLQQRGAQRDCGGARCPGRDRYHRASAGHHSGAGRLRRGNPAARYACRSGDGVTQ